ncbi:hypothetical protein NEOLEDRAFT_586689 [Neolentinus lepideus HHB14362 ss-1]|uniref:Uncharacterized protein n=1 Tax=Neolentinus lepideus HHB14362 ss-1 TaxID=1314782 RepID=A0A165V781_9AGAM|nr:hypothetical protein NEOLEDRAFT_586689 [Neolentinus lepideus HHB14362 ss-1]
MTGGVSSVRTIAGFSKSQKGNAPADLDKKRMEVRSLSCSPLSETCLIKTQAQASLLSGYSRSLEERMRNLGSHISCTYSLIEIRASYKQMLKQEQHN